MADFLLVPLFLLLAGFVAFVVAIGAIAVFPITVCCAVVGWLVAGHIGALAAVGLAGLLGFACLGREV